MNYWPAEVTNLADCAEPLFTMIAELAETGARTARTHYGARGWVLHHNSDLWRNTAPVDGPRSGMWPTGGAWLATHLWEHYLYSGDKAFLARVYPIMKGAAEFFVDTLVEDPSGRWLITSPSLSPENRHHADGTVAAGPAMDSQILRDLFGQVIEAGRILGIDDGVRQAVATARSRLAPDRIGAGGQLQEWLEDWDMTAPEPTHRHVSHLYAVYPSAQLSSGTTPALTAAARDVARPARRRVHRLGDGLANRALGQARRSRARLQADRVPHLARAHVPEHVRRAPAVPDRRQLRGHGGHGRDAAAVARRRDRPAAGAAEGVADGQGHRAARARRLRRRSRVAGRHAAARDDSLDVGHDGQASVGHGRAHRHDEARRRADGK